MAKKSPYHGYDPHFRVAAEEKISAKSITILWFIRYITRKQISISLQDTGSETSKAGIFRYARMFFRWAHNFRLISENPMSGLHSPKARPLRNVLTPSQMQILLQKEIPDWILASKWDIPSQPWFSKQMSSSGPSRLRSLVGDLTIFTSYRPGARFSPPLLLARFTSFMALGLPALITKCPGGGNEGGE